MKRQDRPTSATLDLVYARSGMVCEVCGTTDALSIHHRRLRSQGGTHEPSNLLHVCDHGGCHDVEIHAHPKQAYRNGWLVPSYRVSASVPVLYRTGQLLLLLDDGTLNVQQVIEHDPGLPSADGSLSVSPAGEEK